MKRYILLLLFIVLLSLQKETYAQNIIKKDAIILPQAPATSYQVSPGKTVKIMSSQSVTLAAGTYLQEGSNVTITIGGSIVDSAPSNPSANNNLNWVSTKSYDEDGNVIGEDKSFFDKTGKLLQSQVKSLSVGHVLASQPVYDAQARAAISTLSAPTNNSEFNYKADFVINNAGGIYNQQNFDKSKTNSPDPVGNSVIGTLGWYYSNNNTFEQYVPATGYPYSRNSFFNDGSATAKNIAGVGDELRMGKGHELSSGDFPVLNELDFYNSVRKRFFSEAIVGSLNSLTKNALQSYSADQNGSSEIEITDLSGKSLMVARGDANGVLSINNSTFISAAGNKYVDNITTGDMFGYGGPTYFSINSKYNVKVIYDNGNTLYEGIGNNFVVPPYSYSTKYIVSSDNPFNISVHSPAKVVESDISSIHYFRLLQASNVTITGSYELYDMNTETEVLAGFLPAGYYKVRALSENVNINYTNKLSDISFVFYNQKGEVLASIAPEGVKALLTNGIDNYSSLANVPFVNTFEYDLQGRLIASKSVDAGRTEFIYRKDGNIRFSQNAEQRKTGRFSYTNYDRWDRPFESGEYLPGDVNFDSAKTNVALQENSSANGGLTGGTRQSQIISHYDLPDQSHGLAAYVQDEAFLKGAVSWTENGNAKSWYNYDEQGRLKWLIKSINGLGIKTINYNYNGTGQVATVDYQKENATERFVHHYEYDADLRLNTVYTSLDGVNKLLQAQYYYYLHGPLKRVELADHLQGIDYTYTAQGLLKAINHPDGATDPGKDGTQNGFAPDAFSMTLEYFNGDFSRAGTNINSLNPNTNKPYYNGNITAQSWKSLKPNAIIATYGQGVNNPAMYTYEYDEKYQFNNNKFGNPNFTSNTFNEQQSANREHGLTYDANGNIQSLNRNNASGSQLSLNYHYQANTNKLQSVDNYASYSYDELGQMVGQQRANGQGYYVTYNVSGKVDAIYTDAAKTQLRLSFAYDEAGNRIGKTDHTQNVTTYYVYDMAGKVLSIYDNNGTGLTQKEVPVYATERLGTYTRLNNNYQYELTDNLGNVRVVLNRNKTSNGQADIVYYSDYYPFGSALTLANNDYRYGYQGQYAELDKETGWNNFDLRMYDPAIGRWMSTDPMGQYASPYVGMGNNPVDHVDPDGGEDGPGPEKTYKATGKALEVTITGKRMGVWDRMAFRSGAGLDKYKYSNGGTDYEAMNFSNTYASMKKPKDLQWYLIEAAMWADGAEGLYLGGKFLYKGGGYLAKRYFARKIGVELVEVAAKGGTTVFRAVDAVEGSIIKSTGRFSLQEGGVEAKYFAKSLEDAHWYGQRLYPNGYSIIQGTVKSPVNAAQHWFPHVDIGAYVFPKETLPYIIPH
ncbi:RHS repeat domain-containing protein [Pedobacter nototheniae]|uniref:RHS repeat domain-containing protein n=1 Tax=Pedobacter nototheniae TaxID=2488994 RepID=UPI00103B3473|nr:RHS repeat-associated core domain-containing protein [Pedobacter nototheniae]